MNLSHLVNRNALELDRGLRESGGRGVSCFHVFQKLAGLASKPLGLFNHFSRCFRLVQYLFL